MDASPSLKISISLQKNDDGTFSSLLNDELICTPDGRRLDLKTRHGAVVAAQLHSIRGELRRLEAASPRHERTCILLRQSIEQHEREIERAEKWPEVERAGLESLARLFDIAHGASGQCEHAARFLLACYNGARFPFDFTRLRCLDTAIFYDCMAILEMDSRPQKNVHLYFENGSSKFEALAKRWRMEEQVMR
jgi:hypothetical protein